MRQGIIYKIVNDINDKIYVGQTTRNLETRFNEHCFDRRSNSKIHQAIAEYGHQHFKIEEIEKVDIDVLDDREKFWVEYYNSYYNGYNSTIDGQSLNGQYREYDQILVAEKNIIFDSKEEMSRIISLLTSWSLSYVKRKIEDSLNNDKDFLGYTLKRIKVDKSEITSIDEIEDWVKTLFIKFSGKHIYSPELNKNFDTITTAAIYLLENDLYTGKSKTPIQTLITAISKSIKKEWSLSSTTFPISFREEVGTTKTKGSETPFEKKRVFCPEIDKIFDSLVETADYFIDNSLFIGIAKKTAKLRITDVVRGYFKDYKGYHFYAIDENNNIIEPPLLKIQEKYFID